MNPISKILKLCLTEKETIASSVIINSIKGNFIFESDEIDMLSMQLNNNQKASKMIPKERFSVEFDANKLEKILKNKETSKYELYILLSCVSWIIHVEYTQTINNFGLILDLLNTFPDTIGINTVLSLYELTNYFFECIFKLHQEYTYQDIEYQIMRFLNRYKVLYQEDIVNDTLLKWLAIGYSFKTQTSLIQNILSYTGIFAQENSTLFSEKHYEKLCNIIKGHLSIFNSFELSFLIKYAKLLPSKILIDNLNFLIESILPYFEYKNDIQYKLFDKEKYSKTVTPNEISSLPNYAKCLFQFSSFKYAFQDEIYIFPCVEVDPSFSFQDFIFKIIKRIYQIFENGKITESQDFALNILFENMLKACLNEKEKHPYLFDVIAAILYFIKLCNKYDSYPIFQILIDSPLFDEQLTIFTENSENESVHKLRMISYYILIFQNEQNIQLFFAKKMNYPLMLSEFFFYGLNYQKYKSTIPKEILNTDFFLNGILESILSYLNKEEEAAIQNLNISDCKKFGTNSFSSFDMKKIENSIVDVNSNENLPLQDNENKFSSSSDNTDINNLPFHFKTHSSLLLSNEYDESSFDLQQHLNNNSSSEIYDSMRSNCGSEKNFEINYSFESLHSNSSQQLSLIDTSNENSTKKYQSIRFNAPRIHHREPIDDSKNNFLKWFNAIKNNEQKSNNLENDKYTIDNFLQCSIVYALVFISKIIENYEEVASLWNQSPNLISLFFHLLYNEYIRPIILDILFKIWSSKKSNVTMSSQASILTIFKQTYDDDYSLLDLQLLKTINRYLYHNLELVVKKTYSFDESFVYMSDQEFLTINEPFIEVYPLITSILAYCDISSDFLHNSMIFFSFYTKIIKRKARAAISSALFRIEGKEPDLKFYHDFILIITSFNNEKESPEFLITQPKMVSVFIESFSQSKLIGNVFNFINLLCENSVANTHSCHTGNVDTTLIKYILKYKESPLITTALKLLSRIASTASSIPVVSQFISLFCPIKSHFTPPYILDCIQTFTSIIGKKDQQPTAYLPISKKSPHVSISKLTGSKVYQGFTFAARLFIDKFAQKFHSKLLSISDSKSNMAVMIMDGNITFYDSTGYFKNFDVSIPINSWFNVAITFIPSKNIAQCYIENCPVSILEKCIFPSFISHKSLNCEIGNGSASDLFMAHAALIGEFSFYPIQLDLIDFNKVGELPIFDFKNKETTPWISIKFDIDQSLLHMVVDSIQPELNASLVGENLITNLSFSDVLLKYFKADILIPLFAQIGFPVYKSNQNETNSSVWFSKVIHDLLAFALKLSKDVQESFVKSQGFRIISYLIMNIIDPSILTYDFYMHFVDLLQNLDDKNLSIQLFYHILINTEIWSLSSADVIDDIVKFWYQDLLNQDWFLKLAPLFKLIPLISLFYRKFETEKNKESLIQSTRQNILHFLFDVASSKFDEFDLNSLFMASIAEANRNYSNDLIELIQMIAKIENSPLLQFSQSKRRILFNALDAVLKYHDEEKVFLTIKTILTLHERKIIQNVKLFVHIEIIKMSISKSLATESFITKMIELAESSFPEALSIPFYLIMSSLSSSYSDRSKFLNNQQLLMSMVVKNLHPNPKYHAYNRWLLWPLIFAIKNEEIMKFMIDFIVLCSLNSWVDVFVIIYVVCLCLDVDPAPVQRTFLIILANHFLNGKVTEDVSSFFSLALYFMITKHEDYESHLLSKKESAFQHLYKRPSAFQRLYKDSVFYEEESVGANSCVKSISNENINDNEANNQSTAIDSNGQIKSEVISQFTTELIDSSSNESIGQSAADNHNNNNNNISNDSLKEAADSDAKMAAPFFDEDLFMRRMHELSNESHEASDFKFSFDIDENGKWLDQELSEYFLNVYYKHESDKYAAQYSAFVQYLEQRKRKGNDQNAPIKHIDLFEIYQSKIKFVGDVALLIKMISISITKSKDKALLKMAEFKNEIDKACNDSHQYYNIIVVHQREANKEIARNLWSDLWRNLTNDRSPWRNSLPLSETHFKRNNRILAYFCPVKLKQNLNFKNHKDAAFNREYGSSEMAKEKLIKYQNDLNEKIKKEAPPPLLCISHNETTANSLNYENFIDDQNADFDALKIEQQADFYFHHCYCNSNANISSNSNSSSTGSNAANRSLTAQASQIDFSFEQKRMKKYNAKLLTLKGQIKIDFCVLPSSLRIVYKNNKNSNINDNTKTIKASSIKCILFRSYLHQEKSFEIVKKSGKSYLINLKDEKSLDLLQKLKSDYSSFKPVFIQTLPPSEFIKKIEIQTQWKNGLMSNFEYLMNLNYFGGRSFNETAIYPVFPWIIKDYSSSKIDLEDPLIYRDFSKPIGALNKERLEDLKKHLLDYISFRNVGFLYNSCFISPLCVYLWLIRVEPFTSLHIDLQSGRFDYASRIFTSIPAAFNMVTNHMNDYRELIPEFFYTSSFLENRNHFDLGILRNKPVDDVVLPNWSKTAIEFIYTHRKALESDYVNQHLNEWIDLIFGYCQKGQKAEERDNTFDPCLYEDIWSYENKNDETQRKMIKAVLKHCGHIPNQLFYEPHPIKNKFIVKPIAKAENFLPSTDKNFPKSCFAKLFNVKTSDQNEYFTMQCTFVAASGIISLATVTTKYNSKETYYSVVSHPSVGQLKSSSNATLSSRKLLEKVPSTPLSISPYNLNTVNDNNINGLYIGLTIANMSEKFSIFAFNPGNSLLVVATNIGAIIIAQLFKDNIKEETILSKHVGKVNCVAISDNFIASGGSDTSINIWSSSKDIELKKIQSKPFSIPLSPQSSSLSLSKQKNEADKKLATNIETTQAYKIIVDNKISSPIRHLKAIQSFRDEITCIDINENFGTIASGTRDGSIMLIDTETLESTVTIEIAPEVPMMVKITSGWGFVVVYSNKEHEGQIKSYISVFDIDGQLIKKRQINFEISCWTQYTSLDGFDYMIFGSINSSSSSYQNAINTNDTSNGNIDEKPITSQGGKFNLYMFEVFYLDIEDAGVKKSDTRYIDLKYCVKEGVLYAVTENGVIHIYPSDELNTKRFHRTIFGNDV